MERKPFFLYEKDPGEFIATLTLNRPEKNNCAPGDAEEQLLPLIHDWEEDDNIKVVIIKAAGANFCAGHDLTQWGAVDMTDNRPREERRRPQKDQLVRQLSRERDVMRRLFFSLKPTICQVHGLCVEWGNMIQVMCDMTIASYDAKFGNLGQTIGIAGITTIRQYFQLIGQKRTREMLTTGRLVTAREADHWGLINRAVPRDKLEDEVMRTAKRIALIPLDGIVTGKAYAQLVYEHMGLGATFVEAGFAHSLGAFRLYHQPNEYHFFKEVREVGISQAIKNRNARYEALKLLPEMQELY